MAQNARGKRFDGARFAVKSRTSACRFIRGLVDPGSFVSWDQPIIDPLSITDEYANELLTARDATGVDEAVLTGEGLLRGRRVAIVAGEFSFLAGSIGVSSADRLVRSIERATAERLPLIATPASGGTRMQEGVVAFVQMIKITSAIAKHKAEGLPYLVYIRHPTTGGVLASWGSQGDVTFAAPGSLIGFLGPRVYEMLNGREFPVGVQTGENLFERGVIDAVVAPGDLVDLFDRCLNVMQGTRRPIVLEPVEDAAPSANLSAWEAVLLSRRSDRPGVRQLLSHAARDVVTLNGTGQGERDAQVVLALARFGQVPCVLVGHDRHDDRAGAGPGPAALRTARRGIRLAAQLDLPLVTVVDTGGAELSKEAEEGALAGEIARCLMDLVNLATPVVSIVLGAGTGGAAIALLPGDRILAAEHGWLAPLPPEGASAIVYRDTSHAAELAQRQGVRAQDLLANGIVDRVVSERPDAADEPRQFCRRLGHLLEHELAELMSVDREDRLKLRSDRFRRIADLWPV